MKNNNKCFNVLSTIILIAGIALIATSFIEFFIKFGTFESPKLFFLGFIGMPLTFVGLVMRQNAIDKTNQYNSNQINPSKTDKSDDLFNEHQVYLPNKNSEHKKSISNNDLNKPKESAFENTSKKNKGHKIKCRFCAKVNKPGVQYCERCGTRLSLVCARCRTANEIGEKNCRNCGKRI